MWTRRSFELDRGLPLNPEKHSLPKSNLIVRLLIDVFVSRQGHTWTRRSFELDSGLPLNPEMYSLPIDVLVSRHGPGA